MTLARPFDELAEGDAFETRGRTVTEADVMAFASLTGDMHPQHTDRHWAAEGRFGERVAHGMLVLSYTVGLMPFEPELVVALRGFEDVAFKRPVLLGDTIAVTGRIDSLQPLDEGHGLVSVALRVRNHRGELVARARLAAVWRRQAADREPAGEAVTSGFDPIPL